MENTEFDVAVITVSDKATTGDRVDTGGPLVCEMLKEHGFNVVFTEIVPDVRFLISEAMIKYADEENVALIVTTGGTGFTERDVTPEATLDIIQKRTPGIPEAMRYESLKVTKRAMLSRMEAGIRNKTLIINLPGSPKAIKENLDAVIDSLGHGLEMLIGKSRDCAQDREQSDQVEIGQKLRID